MKTVLAPGAPWPTEEEWRAHFRPVYVPKPKPAGPPKPRAKPKRTPKPTADEVCEAMRGPDGELMHPLDVLRLKLGLPRKPVYVSRK